MLPAPPQALWTEGACGPAYVLSNTGYLRDGSKSGGLISIASIAKPSRRRHGDELGLRRGGTASARHVVAIDHAHLGAVGLVAAASAVGVLMSLHVST